MAAECRDGLPDHGKYASLLKEAGSPQGFLDMLAQPDFAAQDQWQIQIQAQIQQKANVSVYSDRLTDEQIKGALFTPCRNIPQLIDQLSARSKTPVRICAMPDGPQTIAYLAT
jgi:hypothetical protein